MADHLGQQLGKYRLTQLLGTGGFAEIYLGVHIHLGTEAAIKLLHAQLATEAEGEKFRQEARTVATLIHPNIVRVLDFDIEDGTPYLVMDYAPNGSLRQLLPAGVPLAPASIAPYLAQLAEALQYAHDQKLVHRDIKPENMLLGRRNEVLLSDFGIATIAQTTSQQKTEGVAGTAAYMAPEQLHGKPRPSSDLYSLAVVLYEWLAGERPFQGSFVEIASQHLFTPPPPLREKVSGLSPEVEQVVMTALAKDPKDRFGSVRAFATAFLQASGASTSLTSFETRIAASGAQPPMGPIGSSGILVSADSQRTPHITPQLSASSGPGTASALQGAVAPLQPPMASPGPQIGLAAPSILSVPTQITPAAPAVPAVGNQGPQSVFFAETQLTPPTAGTVLPQPGTGPTPAVFAASGPANGNNEGNLVTYMPPGWHTPSAPPHDAMNRSQTSLSGLLPPGMPPESGSNKKSGRRLLVIALVVVLALVLIGGGATYAVVGGLIHTGASSTTVTIMPKSSDQKLISNITGVTGTPDASQMQVSARTVSVTTAAHSQKVNATGQQTTPGTTAVGTADVFNGYSSGGPTLTYAAGTTFPNNAGCTASSFTMVLDAPVSVPPGMDESAPVHVQQAGPVRDPNNPNCAPLLAYQEYSCGGGSCIQVMMGVTTDGTNPQTQTAVAQSDIDNAANSLIQANQPDAQQVLQGQLKSNEQLAGTPRCTPKTSADHNASDVADQVTVTVTFTCTGVAYDHDGALSLAEKLLKSQAGSELGTGYALAGQIKAALVSATPNDQGTVAIVINTEGIWAYQFSSAQKQSLASLIADKSKQQALSLLDAQMGIAQVNIQIPGGDGQNLPANASQITINIATVSGL